MHFNTFSLKHQSTLPLAVQVTDQFDEKQFYFVVVEQSIICAVFNIWGSVVLIIADENIIAELRMQKCLVLQNHNAHQLTRACSTAFQCMACAHVKEFDKSFLRHILSLFQICLFVYIQLSYTYWCAPRQKFSINSCSIQHCYLPEGAFCSILVSALAS